MLASYVTLSIPYTYTDNTWHAYGTVHCTSNPRVSSLNHCRVCPEYFDPRAQVVPHPPTAAVVAPPTAAIVVA